MIAEYREYLESRTLRFGHAGRIGGMSIRFSNWCAWTNRQDMPGIDKPGVYAIARSVKRGTRPDLRSRKIIYVGYTEQTLRGRLNAFDRASGGKKGHAEGNSLFGKHICHGLKDRIDELVIKLGLNRRDAAIEARLDANCENRMSEFAETWARKSQVLSVSVWVPTARWEESYSDLPVRERLKFVEAKLLVNFVRKNKKMPELNRTFG